LTNYLNWCLLAYPIDKGSGSVFHSTISFDATVTSIFPALVSGKSVHILPESYDFEALGQVLKSEGRFSVVKLTPAHLDILATQLNPEEASGLTEAMVIGGENLPAEKIEFWQENAPDTFLYNEYGPTETVVGCAVYESSGWKGSGSVPIGKVIPNMVNYVLDAKLNPVPIGVPGELYIGGVGVARGYHARPELTALKFIPNPFTKSGGERLYKTGDLVRFLRNGQLEFIGRIDEQVKIKGYRIEPGEIQSIMIQYPDIRDAFITAREDKVGVIRLVAYYIAENDRSVDSEELTDFLSRRLPQYMIPSLFIPVTSFPLTINGKVDVKALPAPDFEGARKHDEYIPPSTDNEHLLVKIWQQVLGIEKIGISDNFFSLGGDSILSIQVVAKAKSAGLKITPLQIFQYQTIANLANVAEDLDRDQVNIVLVDRDIPLLPVQHWFFGKNYPSPHHWNQSLLLKTPPDISPIILQKIVIALLSHHDSLRMRFVRGDNDWRQELSTLDGEVPFLYIDHSKIPEEKQSACLEKQISNLHKSLNFISGPISYIAYFNLGTRRAGRLFIAIHHLVTDGVSWRILVEDFQTAFHQTVGGVTIELPPKTNSYGEWAMKLVEYAGSEVLRKEIDYWKTLGTRKIQSLPRDYPEGENLTKFEQTVPVSLSEEETEILLREVTTSFSVQLNEILLTALVRSFSRWTGKRTLFVELEGHGREEIINGMDLSRTVGWFTTLYPVNLELKNTINPEDALRIIKDQLREVPRRGIGYGVLKNLSKDPEIRSSLSSIGSPEISFNYLGQFDQAFSPDSGFDLAPDSKGEDRHPENPRHCLINIESAVREKKLFLGFTYSTKIFSIETMQALASYFEDEIHQIIHSSKSPDTPGMAASDFPLANLKQDKLNKLLENLDKTRKS
jgi:non-ribosomal peptide synthase protein (TIGR01720 family)